MNDFSLKIRISVVIPTCHRNDLLAKCLDCLAPGVQTLPPEQYEVIVTDDGSRSTAQQMVTENYPWAQWTEGPRRGPAHNRNHGAALAKGEWLAFTDDDCLPLPSWLTEYVNTFEKNTLVYEGKTICSQGVTSPIYQAPINLTGGCLWSCNFVIQSALFCDVGGFESDFAMPTIEDIDLHERLCHKGETIKFAEAAVVDHPPRRTHSGQVTGKIFEAKVQSWTKHGQLGYCFVAYFKHLKHQIHWMRGYGYHRDMYLALYNLSVEASYVLPRLALWERKYRKNLL